MLFFKTCDMGVACSRGPGFTAIAVLSLALGIGGNALIFVPMHQQGVASRDPQRSASNQQVFDNQLFLVVRTEGDAAAMLPAVRSAIAARDPEQPVYAIQTMDDVLSEASFGQRMSVVLFGLFAAVAVTLAGIGIYGVMSYAVAARLRRSACAWRSAAHAATSCGWSSVRCCA